MRRVMYDLDIGYVGCNDEDVLEVPDGTTDAQLDAMVHEMALEHAASWEGDERLCWDSEMTEEERDDATAMFYEGVSGSWRELTDDDEA